MTLNSVLTTSFGGGGATIFMMVGGDSIANALADPDGVRDEFIGYLADRNINATIYDGAQGGQQLLNFVDFATGGKGPKYLAMWDDPEIVDKTKVTDIHFTIGANDVSSFTNGTYTKAQYKAAYSDLIDLVFSDFPVLERFHIRPIGRWISDSGINLPTALQEIRELQHELAEEKENVYLLPPYYDLEQGDTVHPTTASYDMMAKRDADRIAHILGLRGAQGVGMSIASAVVSTLGIDVTVNFDNGNDITVPTAGNGLDFFRIDGDTNFQRIDRVDNNTFRLYGGAPYTGTPTLQTAYGTMFALGLDPETVQENGGLTLPLIQEEVTVANTLDDSDPILRLTDLAYYARPEDFARNTTTGNNFDSTASINNTEFELYDVGSVGIDMTFDATAFGGAGGFRPSADGGFLRGKGDLLNPSSGWFGGFVVEFDNTAFATEQNLFTLGRDAGMYGNARLYTRTGLDRITLGRNQAGGSPIVTTGVLGNRLAIILNIKSASDMDIYINDGTTPILTLDPNNDWLGTGADTIYIGGQTSTALNIPFAKEGAHNASNDPSIASIMNYMKSEYNIT